MTRDLNMSVVNEIKQMLQDLNILKIDYLALQL